MLHKLPGGGTLPRFHFVPPARSAIVINLKSQIQECHAKLPPVASRATDRHGTAKTAGLCRGDFRPRKVSPIPPTSTPEDEPLPLGHRPAVVHCGPETMDGSLKYPVTAPVTILNSRRMWLCKNSCDSADLQPGEQRAELN